MTSSNGNIFRVTGPLCGEFTGRDEFPTQRPVTRSFDVLFDLCLNKRLSKQPWGWWFETPSWSSWRHRNKSLAKWAPDPWFTMIFRDILLQWRHNEHDGISNHRRPDSLLNHLFRYRWKKTSTLCVTGTLWGESFVRGIHWSPVSNAENAFIWWRHHIVGHSN